MFQIFLPTGAQITVTRNWYGIGWSQFMNIEIHPGLADQFATSGLCGNYDGDSSNDGEREIHPRTSRFYLLLETSLQKHR